MKKIYYFFIFLLTIFLTIYFNYQHSFFSPDSKHDFTFLTKEFNIVGGFIPHWTLNKISQTNDFNNLYYFSFEIKPNGEIEKNSQNDLGYYRFFNNENAVAMFSKNKDQKRNLTITQLNKNDIEVFLNNKKAQKTLIKEIKPFFENNFFDSLNIDIEYSGTQSASLRDRFTDFIDLVNQDFADFDNFELSVCVYARAAQYQQIWDIEKLSPKIDYFIIMAYDYFNSSSLKPGPVAPLADNFNHNIIVHLKSFLKIIDSEKIVLGIPLYGYGWQVNDFDPKIARVVEKNSFSLPLNSIFDLPNNREIDNLSYHWDDVSFSPYLTYQKDDEKYIVYYEDKKSLKEKINVAKKLNLEGVAFWVLGYQPKGFDWNFIFDVNSN